VGGLRPFRKTKKISPFTKRLTYALALFLYVKLITTLLFSQKNAMTKKRLPIGIQSFKELRKLNCYYVDKTEAFLQLIKEGKYYFLSRPRRFGKSLMVDTLQCLFEGRQTLFDDLYIADKWDWNTRYPVVRLSFGDGVAQTRAELDNRINYQLAENRQRLGISANTAVDIPGNFRDLIRTAKDKRA